MRSNAKIKLGRNNYKYLNTYRKANLKTKRLDLNTLIEKIRANEKGDKINKLLIIYSIISIFVLIILISFS
jgi:hypothetical protein